MSRSLKKGGYYIDNRLLEKIRVKKESSANSEAKIGNENKVIDSSTKPKKGSKKSKTLTPGSIKTWSRGTPVHPEMIGETLLVHYGNGFKEVKINAQMVGLKLGVFAQTRKKGIHGKAGKH